MVLPPSFCKAEAPRVVRQPVNFRPARIVRPPGESTTAPTWRETVRIALTIVQAGLRIAWPIAPTGSRIARNSRDNRVDRRDEIRDHVHDHPIRDFWSEYPGWAALRITRPYRWATWGAITGWVGYGWSEPVPYGYGENVYYEGDSVYYGDEVVATTEEYTQQAEEIAASAPEVAPDQADWMPLGVFALTPDGQASGPDPTLFLQLAISKEGIISGTLNNSATDKTQTIEGMADKKSQRCAWTVAGQTRPIMETGINNLTEDTAPALVHFADGQTQQWLMVRLEEPAPQP